MTQFLQRVVLVGVVLVPTADNACPIYGQTAKNVRPLTAKPGEQWVIRWNRSDDFSGSAVDWRKWQKTPANFPAWKWDNENNVSVSNGLLTITLRKQGDGLANSGAYTSGMLKSYTAGRYGYFEARIKAAPLFPGVCPAFWLYSRIDDSQTQPRTVRYCEVDIVELTQRNSHATGNVQISDHNLHAILSNGKNGLAGREWRRPHDPRYREAQALDYRAPFDPREDFHTYGCRIDKDSIIWFVDGVEVGRKRNELWHEPMSVALSLGLRAPYATWEDNRLKADPNAGPTEFDTSMVVDYVRVWELAGDAIGSDTQELRKPTKK